jgi:hypothetical protein
MHVELNDEQTEVLIRQLSQLIENDHYPLSPRIVALKESLGSYGRSLNANPAPAPALRAAEQGTVRTATGLMDGLYGGNHNSNGCGLCFPGQRSVRRLPAH